MKCISCGAASNPGMTTDVTEVQKCLVIVRNVPCYKCSECNEIMYSGDVIKRLEEIMKSTNQIINEITIIDYQRAAA